MKNVRTDRNIWKDIVLWSVLASIASFLLALIPRVGVVLGIIVMLGYLVYYIYYYWNLVDDLNTVCGHVEKTDKNDSWNYILVWFVGVITLNAYNVYWHYKQGGRLHKALKVYGVDTEETGAVYLLWNTVGVVFCGNFISKYLLIKNLNYACAQYNVSFSRGSNLEVGQAPNPKPVSYNGADSDVTRSVPVIVGVRGEYANQDLTVSQGEEIVMGRDAQKANLVFASEKISKVHCRITFNRGENCYYVTDQSRNGVFIEGGRQLAVGKAERISRGTKIRIGDNEVFLLR